MRLWLVLTAAVLAWLPLEAFFAIYRGPAVHFRGLLDGIGGTRRAEC